MPDIKKNKSPGESGRPIVIFSLTAIIILGLFMRIHLLGNTFTSSDNAFLAVKILKYPGFSWMVLEQYGLIISFIDKLAVSFIALIGITVTEFWWKLPIALIGTLQIPLTFFFLRRLTVSTPFSILGSAFIAVLPIHIFQSRYLWGYEVIGAFFLTLAIWTLLNFFENPGKKSGILASIFSGLYVISHGYFISFFPILAVMILLFAQIEEKNIFKRFLAGLILYLKNYAWLFLLLLLPFTARPLIHMLFKKASFGFYIFTHIPDFVKSSGIFLTALFFSAFAVNLFNRHTWSSKNILFLIISGAYLAPLLLGTPPGATVVKGYMLIGIISLIIYSMLIIDHLSVSVKKIVYAASVIIFSVTLWGSIESIFFRDMLFDPSLVKQGRGKIRDTGTRAAGYIILKYVPESKSVFAMHRAIEEPNLSYYFHRKKHAYNDLRKRETVEKFNELKNKIDVVICSKWQATYVESDKRFIKRSVIRWNNKPVMLIYSKRDVEIPSMDIEASELNDRFHREYSWNRKILKNFLSDENISFGQIIFMREKKEKHRKLIKKYLYFLYD